MAAASNPNSTLQDKLVVLLGGGGFMGRHLAQELMARGARLRVVSRHVERAYAVKALGNLGQVQFARADITRHDARLTAVLAGADAVVNLAGAFAGDLDAVQGKGLAALAGAAHAAGAGTFVHVSAIGADAASPVAYARTKAEGEAAVLGAFPGAIVIRPSILFGPDDSFLNRFGALAALPVLPVLAPAAKLQPLFVDDAAEAIAAALENPAAHAGQTHEIAGPEVITMLALNQRVAAAAGRHPLILPVADDIAAPLIALTGWLPGAPITSAQFRLLKAGNVASGALPGLAELGVKPRPLGLFLDRWMLRYREHGRFGNKAGPA